MPHEHTFPWQPNRLCTFPRCSPRNASPRVLQVAPHSLLAAMARGGGAWDFFPCAVPALAMAAPTYSPGFSIPLLLIAFFVCQKKQNCKSAVVGTVGMCITGSLLAAVGKYVCGVWKIYFPCHMNVLFHGSLTGYAHFHGAPPNTSPQVLQVAPPSEIQKDCRFTIFFVKRQPSSNCLFNVNPSLWHCVKL